MWWGRVYPDVKSHHVRGSQLRPREVDYRNAGVPKDANSTWLLEDAGVTRVESAAVTVDSLAKNEEYEKDVNERGRGRTVETQSGGLAVLRALWQWESLANGGQN
jgi:hypothetical protein